jgi:hypothetical protein
MRHLGRRWPATHADFCPGVRVPAPPPLVASVVQFDCCGYNNSADMPKNNCNATLPGCQTAVEDFYNQYFTAIMISAAVLAAVEIFGLIFSATLASSQEAKNGGDV